MDKTQQVGCFSPRVARFFFVFFFRFPFTDHCRRVIKIISVAQIFCQNQRGYSPLHPHHTSPPPPSPSHTRSFISFATEDSGAQDRVFYHRLSHPFKGVWGAFVTGLINSQGGFNAHPPGYPAIQPIIGQTQCGQSQSHWLIYRFKRHTWLYCEQASIWMTLGWASMCGRVTTAASTAGMRLYWMGGTQRQPFTARMCCKRWAATLKSAKKTVPVTLLIARSSLR